MAEREKEKERERESSQSFWTVWRDSAEDTMSNSKC